IRHFLFKDKRVDKCGKGSVFCIYPNATYQLTAETDVEFVFLCPELHVTGDRTLFSDRVSPSSLTSQGGSCGI
ncbi:hypothetical protein, partial [Yersinia pestis]|uniref:hypothetical protein n=4 Tax=Yersinia pestis TaxID=632 RepID=UPI0020B13584